MEADDNELEEPSQVQRWIADRTRAYENQNWSIVAVIDSHIERMCGRNTMTRKREVVCRKSVAEDRI